MARGSCDALGDIVTLKVECLGNPAGTKGFVYEFYQLGDHIGISVIFVNGEYSGFSYEETLTFLEDAGHVDLPYTFSNVIKLSEDFRNGYFKEVLS